MLASGEIRTVNQTDNLLPYGGSSINHRSYIMHFDPLDRFISIKEVCAKLGVGKPTNYLWIGLGKFPHPHSLGLRCSRWLESEALRWMAEKH